MTLASGIYVGWVAAGLAFFVAILLLLGCCGQSEDTSDDYSAGSHNGRQSQRTAYGQQLQPNYLQHQNPPPIHHPHQQMQSGMQSYPYQSNTFQTQPSYHNASTMHQQYSQKSISRHHSKHSEPKYKSCEICDEECKRPYKIEVCRPCYKEYVA